VQRFLDTPVKRYSSGMYVRLAFAVAAHLDPEILIVDEVLAVGDAEFQRKSVGKMRDVSKSGRTVLFVSHNMSAVRSLCSAAIMLDRGRLLELGPPSVVTDAYLRKSFSSSAHSLLTANVERQNDIKSGLKIVSFSINDGESLLHGETASFTFSFESIHEYTDVAFAVALCSLDGSRIMSIDSDIPGERYTISKGAHGQATLSIDAMHLAPANYLIDIAVRSGDNYMLDYLPGIMSITVLPSDSTPPVIAMRTSGHGGVRYPCITSIKTN
jgi:lipopolysaccharide transport system ATP-binding protein